MKTVIKKIMVVVMVTMTIASYASVVKPLVKVKSIGDKTFALIIHGLSGEVQISLKDQNGFILLSENHRDLFNYAEKYNLDALPEGRYYLEVEEKVKINVFPLSITSEDMSFDKTDKVNVFKPVLFQKGTNVDIMMLSLNDSSLISSFILHCGHSTRTRR